MVTPLQPPPPAPAAGDSITVLALLAALIRNVRLLMLGVLVGGGLAAAWSLLATERFTATTIFAPGDQPAATIPSGLAALGSQFGAGFSLGQGTRSLQFYSEMLQSHDLLAAVAQDSFARPDGTGLVPLVSLLDTGGDSPDRALENAVLRLQQTALGVTVNDRTGMITLTVTLSSPQLAADVANRIYERLETFNTLMHQSGATARRQFAERELASARADLAATEGALQDFLERNRAGLDMPRLALERARLQRRIDVAQISFGQLTQELTEAKMAEARDIPTFAVIQRAAPPLDRSFPHRTRLTIFGTIIGGCVAALLIAFHATAGTAQALDPAGFSALREAFRRRRPQRRADH